MLPPSQGGQITSKQTLQATTRHGAKVQETNIWSILVIITYKSVFQVLDTKRHKLKTQIKINTRCF
jgi:hypothetical protein